MSHRRLRWAWLAALLGMHAAAQTPVVQRQDVSAAELFPRAQAASLAYTLDPERRVTFDVRVPAGSGPHGVLVFVSPRDATEPGEGWTDVLDRHDLVWIAARDFGNDRRTSQRVLVALMAVKHLQRSMMLDRDRIYIGGLSGGGRVASQALVRFPGFFSGALCIVGADFVTPESALVPELATKRLVFMTGEDDFNRREIRRVFSRFVDLGISRAHLIDLPDFGHELPDAEELDAALGLLDRR